MHSLVPEWTRRGLVTNDPQLDDRHIECDGARRRLVTNEPQLNDGDVECGVARGGLVTNEPQQRKADDEREYDQQDEDEDYSETCPDGDGDNDERGLVAGDGRRDDCRILGAAEDYNDGGVREEAHDAEGRMTNATTDDWTDRPTLDVDADYHRIRPNLIVGTQPTTPADIDRLRDVEGVTCVFNTQQDEDIVYWKVDFAAVEARIEAREMRLVRFPFVDFSADSLREGLPEAAAALDEACRRGETVYLHCTAGMGRSPGLAIAYMYWCLDGYETLDAAYEGLTSIRPCGPKKESIRLATCDALAAGRDEWPIETLQIKVRDDEGTKLTYAQKQSIRRKLRR